MAEWLGRLGLGGAQQLVEAVEAGVPASSTLDDPLAGVLQAGGAGADQVLAPVALALNEPGALEHSQMARDGRQGNVKGPGKRCDAALAVPRKMVNDAAAGRVGQGREDRRNPILMVNHGVKCRARRRGSQENS